MRHIFSLWHDVLKETVRQREIDAAQEEAAADSHGATCRAPWKLAAAPTDDLTSNREVCLADVARFAQRSIVDSSLKRMSGLISEKAIVRPDDREVLRNVCDGPIALTDAGLADLRDEMHCAAIASRDK